MAAARPTSAVARGTHTSHLASRRGQRRWRMTNSKSLRLKGLDCLTGNVTCRCYGCTKIASILFLCSPPAFLCRSRLLCKAPSRGGRRKQISFSRRGFSRPSFANLVIASVSEAIQPSAHNPDCFVATAPRNDDKPPGTKQIGTSGRSCFVYETPLFDSLPAKSKRKRNAGRRIVLCPHTSGVRDAPRKRRLAPPSACGRARLPAFHRGSRQRDFRPEGSASGQASRKRRASCGVPHAPSRLQRSTSRAGRNAGRHDARAARVRSVSFRPRAPHSLRLQEVPSLKASFNERGWLRLLPPRR